MTTYTVYDTQDTTWYRDGLTEQEARALCDDLNYDNSRYGERDYQRDRFAMMPDKLFREFGGIGL